MLSLFIASTAADGKQIPTGRPEVIKSVAGFSLLSRSLCHSVTLSPSLYH